MYKEIFETYVNAVNRCDADAVAELFTENAVFDDKGGRGILPQLPEVLIGREEIREAFKGWVQMKFDTQIVKIMGNVMFYDVVSGGVFIPAVGMVEMRDGKVETYTIRARKEE